MALNNWEYLPLIIPIITIAPTYQPTHLPTSPQTSFPTLSPVSKRPTRKPTRIPTKRPTLFPTHYPTSSPTRRPDYPLVRSVFLHFSGGFALVTLDRSVRLFVSSACAQTHVRPYALFDCSCVFTNHFMQSYDDSMKYCQWITPKQFKVELIYNHTFQLKSIFEFKLGAFIPSDATVNSSDAVDSAIVSTAQNRTCIIFFFDINIFLFFRMIWTHVYICKKIKKKKKWNKVQLDKSGMQLYKPRPMISGLIHNLSICDELYVSAAMSLGDISKPFVEYTWWMNDELVKRGNRSSGALTMELTNYKWIGMWKNQSSNISTEMN
ncbi:hypothetical protein RFI_33342 [Reticulomyxa filosa]|uniref:Uncharacterized protein n=1 Tax=Reticulomyxa filosa TaxID=46433 RepID=X6LTJ7_RETFI|nr:hypothetical protein RFI_33342 [Reticulomyxa filosa]|eukprot:ETO04060.1 hypothetical protein RFI_33342 [Reticulomyxa filosa]